MLVLSVVRNWSMCLVESVNSPVSYEPVLRFTERDTKSGFVIEHM